jgi:hypothetical protein
MGGCNWFWGNGLRHTKKDNKNKTFFFEKKNQKTFGPGGGGALQPS